MAIILSAKLKEIWVFLHAFWMPYCSTLSQVSQCPKFRNASKTGNTHLRSQILYSCSLLSDIEDAAQDGQTCAV